MLRNSSELSYAEGMMMRYVRVRRHPRVFRVMSGLDVPTFDALDADFRPRFAAAEQRRLGRPDRRRALGAGHPFGLDERDQLLLTVVWRRRYPINAVLGYLFGVEETTALWTVQRVLPVLEAAGLDTMRQADPGKGTRPTLDALLRETPALAVVVDTFEQRGQRPRDRATADTFYRGKHRARAVATAGLVASSSGLAARPGRGLYSWREMPSGDRYARRCVVADGAPLTGQPPERRLPERQLVLVVGQATSTGQVRSTNEDSILCEPGEAATVVQRGLFCAVADGMGGHAAGDVASGLAVRRAREAYYQAAADSPERALRDAISAANAAIFAAATGSTGREHMGTTLTAVALLGGQAVVGHVGDSRCYIVRDGTIQQVTRDHSWVADAVAAGELSDAEARTHPRRNIITRALGLGPRVEVDMHAATLAAGDIVVLCSDGLHGAVSDEEIRRYASSLPPQEAADELVALANERGGFDNISVVLIHARDPGNDTTEVRIVPSHELLTPRPDTVPPVVLPRIGVTRLGPPGPEPFEPAPPELEPSDLGPAESGPARPGSPDSGLANDTLIPAASMTEPERTATGPSRQGHPSNRGSNAVVVAAILLALLVLGAAVGLFLVRALGLGG